MIIMGYTSRKNVFPDAVAVIAQSTTGFTYKYFTIIFGSRTEITFKRIDTKKCIMNDCQCTIFFVKSDRVTCKKLLLLSLYKIAALVFYYTFESNHISSQAAFRNLLVSIVPSGNQKCRSKHETPIHCRLHVTIASILTPVL